MYDILLLLHAFFISEFEESEWYKKICGAALSREYTLAAGAKGESLNIAREDFTAKGKHMHKPNAQAYSNNWTIRVSYNNRIECTHYGALI